MNDYNFNQQIVEMECPSCGAILTINLAMKRGFCTFCGNNFVLCGNNISKDNSIQHNEKNEYRLIRDDSISKVTIISPSQSRSVDKYAHSHTVYGIRNKSKINNGYVFVAYLSAQIEREYSLYIKIGTFEWCHLYEEKRTLFGKINRIKRKKEKILPEFYNDRDGIYSLLKTYDFEGLDDMEYWCIMPPVDYNDHIINSGICDIDIHVTKIVTPYDFKMYFKSYDPMFHRILNKPILFDICTEIIKSMQTLLHIYFDTDKKGMQTSKKSDDGEFHLINYFSFHSFNMADLPNEEMIVVFSSACAQIIIDQTRKNGKIEWDLSDNIQSNLSSFHFQLTRRTKPNIIVDNKIFHYESW